MVALPLVSDELVRPDVLVSLLVALLSDVAVLAEEPVLVAPDAAIGSCCSMTST